MNVRNVASTFHAQFSLAVFMTIVTFIPLDAYAAPLTFRINLAPNSFGAIDGEAIFRLRWSSWFHTGLELRSETLSEEYRDVESSRAITSTSTAATFEVFSINQNLIYGLTGIKFPSFAFSAGIAAQAALETSRESGHMLMPHAYFFEEIRKMTYMRPLIMFRGRISAGIFSLSGTGLFTPLISYTDTAGSVSTSENPERREFTSSNTGFNGQYSGMISLRTGTVIAEAGFEYSINTYGTETNRSGSPEIYAVQREDYVYSVSVTLGKLMEGLRIGGSWLTSIEKVPQKPEMAFSSERFRIDLGFSLGGWE